MTRTALLPALFALFALGLAPTALANAPAWGLQALAAPTHFVPGDESGVARYEVFLINSGAAATDQNPITITDTLPKGLVVKDIKLETSRRPLIDLGNEACGKTEPPGGAAIVTCVIDESLPPAAGEPAHLLPSEQGRLVIFVAIPASIPEGALLNQVAIEGGGAEPAAAEAENSASAEENTAAGFQEFQAELTDVDGHAVTSAASHPYQYTTSFAVNLNPAPPGADLPFVPAGGDLKGVEVELPPGLIANPRAVGRCSAQQFNTLRGGSPPKGGTITQNECPDDSAVGLAVVEQLEGKGEVAFRVPIYNLDPPPGMPAQLGFQPTIGVPIYIDTAVRSGGPKGLTVHAFVHNVTEAKRVTAGLFTIWGTPADESHDPLRGQCGQEPPKSCPSGLATETPLWRLPTQCQNPLTTTMSFETWAQPSTAASASVVDPAPSGCAVPDFSPAIESKPTTNLADSPSGLHFNLHLPQSQDPKVLGEADLREATVTLPPGLVVNPASADGLGACSPAQIGLKSAPGAAPIEFDEAPAACPPASKVAKVAVTTPLLDHPVEGAAYVATQLDNPFKSLIALYFALEDPETGVIIKLAGEVNPDPVTGQLTTTVPEGPQAPFEDFTFDFLSGARAPLRTPPSCGAHTTSSLMTPWSAPQHAAASPHDDFQLSGGPSGPCPSGALAPKLSAGLANPTAGTYSPFYLRLTRPDGSGEFAGLTAKPPLGLTAKLAGVPYCPQAGIDQAASRSAPGQGALEAAQPSCPAASQIGTTTAGAGAGPTPFYTGGKVYLAGPYKGAPLSLVAIIPALAGPFDLGVVVNRTALQVNSETAQVTAEPDPLPRILFGIPLDLRDVRVDLNRPNFTLAPSSCEPKSVDATVFAPSGASANVSDRFQLGGCEGLGFKPGLSLKLKGGTKRGAHPALKAVVTYPKGAYANVARASVALPHSEFLEQAHIRTICTRVQFAADACPKGSIYGKAKATTPLLDAPLEGPVYLRSSSNPLPDLVIALHGQLDVDLVGRIDSHNGGIRTTFDTVPDAPVTKFTLEMPAGKKGLLVNSRNICNYTNRATAKLTAHNGKIYDFRPVLKDSCKKQGGGKKNKHGH